MRPGPVPERPRGPGGGGARLRNGRAGGWPATAPNADVTTAGAAAAAGAATAGLLAAGAPGLLPIGVTVAAGATAAGVAVAAMTTAGMTTAGGRIAAAGRWAAGRSAGGAPHGAMSIERFLCWVAGDSQVTEEPCQGGNKLLTKQACCQYLTISGKSPGHRHSRDGPADIGCLPMTRGKGRVISPGAPSRRDRKDQPGREQGDAGPDGGILVTI